MQGCGSHVCAFEAGCEDGVEVDTGERCAESFGLLWDKTQVTIPTYLVKSYSRSCLWRWWFHMNTSVILREMH